MGITNLFPTPIYTLKAKGEKFDDIQHELKEVYNKVNFEHLPYAPDAHNVSTDMEGNFFNADLAAPATHKGKENPFFKSSN